MVDPRCMLCTDMGRSVIPNGVQSEYALAGKQFTEFFCLRHVTPTYVTGRHQKLVRQAIKTDTGFFNSRCRYQDLPHY